MSEWNGQRPAQEEHRLLMFTISGNVFAIPAEPVQEVIPVPALARVPRSPAWLLGLMNLRGEVLPVVDPRAALNCVPHSPGPVARVIVLICSRGRVGLLADSTEDVVSVHQADLLPADHAGKPLVQAAVGLVLHRDRLAAIIDAEAFFSGPAFRNGAALTP